MSKSSIRITVRGAYDLQRMRIMTGNRLVANFKAKLGQRPGEKEDTVDAEGQKLLKEVRKAYSRIADSGISLVTMARKGTGDPLISDTSEFAMVAGYEDLLDAEERQFDLLRRAVEREPIWENFLKGVKGCGPAMAGVLISEIDPFKCAYPSSIWKYAGLDVGPDGRGRSRRKEHLVDVTYRNAAGEEATRKSITFNPFLKTKLMGVLAPSFLKSGSPYREHYDNMKHRIESRKDEEMTKLRIHNMAMRYMVKMFLIDYYRHIRTLEGLPVSPTYQEAKLGHVHGAAA